jgi:hypothetical protein
VATWMWILIVVAVVVIVLALAAGAAARRRRNAAPGDLIGSDNERTAGPEDSSRWRPGTGGESFFDHPPGER